MVKNERMFGKILTTTQEGILSVNTRTKYKNPFRPGAGIEPLYIAGRDQEYETFERIIRSAPQVPRNLIISGLRGTGKTVLLRDLRGICEDYNWLFIGREFNERFSSEQEFSQAISTDILTKLKGLCIAHDIKELGKKTLKLLGESELTYQDFSLKLSKQENTELLEDYFLRLLQEAAEVCNESSKEGIVFLYDEFHTISDSNSKKQFPLASFIGALSQAQGEQAPFLLVATGLPQIQANFAKAKSYTERMFRAIKLDNLESDNAKLAFSETLKGSGYIFDDELIDYLLLETGGYPYFIQFYGHFIIDNIPKDIIKLNDFKGIEDLLLRDLDASFFDARYEKASEGEKKVLIAIARLGDDARYIEISDTLKLNTDSLKRLLSRLETKGLIYNPRRGIYSFTLPLFKNYLLRKSKGDK